MKRGENKRKLANGGRKYTNVVMGKKRRVRDGVDGLGKFMTMENIVYVNK